MIKTAKLKITQNETEQKQSTLSQILSLTILLKVVVENAIGLYLTLL